MSDKYTTEDWELDNEISRMLMMNQKWWWKILDIIYCIPTTVVLRYAKRFKGGEGGIGFERIAPVPFYVRICEWFSDVYIIEQGGEYFVQIGKEINE